MEKCCDVAKQLIEEASDKLGKIYKLDRKQCAFMPEVCAAIDSFAESIECEVLDVSVVWEKNDLVFTMISDDITLDNAGLMKQFSELLPMIDSVRFTKAKYDNKDMVKLRTDVAIHKLWKGVDE